MSELDLVARIRAKAGKSGGAAMVLGIGDDCAIYRPRAGEDLVFTTDMLIEDVHFRRSTHSARDAGHKALARSLSDIAAMGAEPRFCLVSLAAAPWTDAKWIDGFYSGLLALARRTGTALAGGDLSHAERLACDVVVCGSVPKGRALRRGGAKPGDGIYVSGALGGSALGLRTRAGAAWKRHLRPEPRLEVGRALGRLATACMDLSDGLSLDLHRLCVESKVAAVIDRPLPVFPGASLDEALHGGEDYELLFTASSQAKIPEGAAGVVLTRIGTIVEGKAGAVGFFGRPLARLGYDHFPPPGDL